MSRERWAEDSDPKSDQLVGGILAGQTATSICNPHRWRHQEPTVSS